MDFPLLLGLAFTDTKTWDSAISGYIIQPQEG
jgi:hypothetical protein